MSFEDRLEKKPRRTILGLGISAIVIVAVLGVVGGGISLITNPFRQAARIVTKTIDADNVIANYEWFKRQNQDVMANVSQQDAATAAIAAFEASAGPRDNWHFEDRQESTRLRSVLLGLKGQHATMVAEYNARSEMANRSLFRTNDLPEHLN